MARKSSRAALFVVGLVAWVSLGPTRGASPAAYDPTGPASVPTLDVPAGPGVWVVDLVDGATEADLLRLEAATGARFSWTHPLARDEAIAIASVPDRARVAAQLASVAGIEAMEPQQTLGIEPVAAAAGVSPTRALAPWTPVGGPDDPMLGQQWNLRDVGLEAAWAAGLDGRGVVVAVIDTGVTRVEDLAGTQLLEGASFVPGVASSADDQGHGTHVAGTIAQTTGNGVGVAGVAPGAAVLPVKVLSAQGFGSSDWIAAGIDYAVDEGADVINLSLGGGYSPVIHNAIKKAREQGVIVVAAAGNSGQRGVHFPGALDETIGVAAVGPDGQRAPYSSFGPGVDLAAPGGDKRVAGGGILQDTIDGRGGHVYAEFQGTSMATPHVAGAAALLVGAGLAPDAVERVLLASARGDGFTEELGHGRLDLPQALGAVVGGFGRARFMLGAACTLLIAQFAGTRTAYQLFSAALGATVAGGLFFVPAGLLGAASFLVRPALEWPSALVGDAFVSFPLWLSAAATVAVGFTLGAFRGTRPLAQGWAGGTAAYLAHAALTGAVAPWWVPSGWVAPWLVGNATACVLVALALAGAQALDEQEVRR